MNTNNLPKSVTPDILPVERRLPPPDVDASTLIRLVTDSLGPNAETVAQLKAQYEAIGLPPNVKRATDKVFDALISMAHSKEPMAWVLNRAHPQAGSKIVRMYHREDGGVEVYSSDGSMFVRTFLPARIIRFFDEVMGEDTFVSFIEDAETEEPEEDSEPESEPESESDPAPTESAATEQVSTE